MTFNSIHRFWFQFSLSIIALLFCSLVQAGLTAATPVNPGQTINDKLQNGESSVNRSDRYYAKFFRFSISTSQHLEIDVEAQRFREHIYLMTESGELVNSVIAPKGKETHAHLSINLSPATYLIEVTSDRTSRTGDFQLTLGVDSNSDPQPPVPVIPEPTNPVISEPVEPVIPEPQPVPPVLSPDPSPLNQHVKIEIGQTINNGLYPGESSVNQSERHHAKFFNFSITEKQNVKIIVDAQRFREHIYLMSESGALISSSIAPKGKGTDAQLFANLNPGTYLIEVTSDRTHRIGDFQLTVDVVNNSDPEPPAPIIPEPVEPVTPDPTEPVITDPQPEPPLESPTPGPRNTQNMIEIGFEKPDLTSNGLNKSGNPPQIVSGFHPVFEGNQSLSIFIDRENSPIEYRTEFTLRGEMYDKKFINFEYNKEYWIGFAIYLNDDYQFPEMSDIVFQTHGVPDFHLGEGYRNPILSLTVTGLQETPDPQWAISILGDSRTVTPSSGLRYTTNIDANLSSVKGDIGRWVSWVIRYKHTYNPDGYIDIWKDGQLVYNENGIRTAYNDLKGSYLKMGSYKWSWRAKHNYPTITPARRQSYLDAVRIAQGENRFDDVAP